MLAVAMLANVVGRFGDRQGVPMPLQNHVVKVAIVVPVRDRREHGRIFHAEMLKHQALYPQTKFDMYYVEQTKLGKGVGFNRAMMFNFGLKEALKTDVDCIVIHDVDRVPVGNVAYEHCHRPTHLASNFVPYASFSGAVFGASPEHWKLINGMSNKFWGWGGEDDELYHRWSNAGLLPIYRPAKTRGQFRHLDDKHHTARKKTHYTQNVAHLTHAGTRSSLDWTAHDGYRNLTPDMKTKYVQSIRSRPVNWVASHVSVKANEQDRPGPAVDTKLYAFQRPLRVYTCGTPNTPNNCLAQELFNQQPAVFTHSDRSIHAKDVLFATPSCQRRLLKEFPGKVIVYNGEAYPLSGKWEKYYSIGPGSKFIRALQVYNVAKYLVLNSARVSNDTIVRLPNTGTHFMMYAASNCVPFRDRAFDRIVDKFNSGSACGCFGSHPERKVVCTPRAAFEDNNNLFRTYRFVLCMENQNAPGYVTEKILNAFLSGAIPVYYGTQEVFNLFNRKAFIYYDISRPDEALQQIAALEANPSLYQDMKAQPILANGLETLRQYFSLSRYIGGGLLRRRILHMMKIPPLSLVHRGTGEYVLRHPNGPWSQMGQDIYVDRYFNHVRSGFFLEIGGYDGEKFSNTLFLEKRRNWDGLLVEANPFMFTKMVNTQRACYMAHNCISNTAPSMEFYIAGGLTSAVGLESASHRNRVKRDTSTYGKTRTWEGAGARKVTSCVPLGSLLADIGTHHVNYFSLDVEGAELHILRSIDWTALTFDMIQVEVQENRADITGYLLSRGYKRTHQTGPDDYFVPIRRKAFS